MDGFFEIAKIGFSDGLTWFPFVLGIGLLYRHLKLIDISIDGTAIAAGIACGFVWNVTKSYPLSILAAILYSILAYSVIWATITKLGVNAILAGILYSLVVHAISVIFVGESLVLSGTELFPGFLLLSPVPIVAAIFTFCGSEMFYKTNIGISTRLVGNNPNANTRFNPNFLVWLGFCVTAMVVGLGAGIYAHQQGVARAGGGFEFLVTGLSSFLVIDRLIEFSLSFLPRKSATQTPKRTQFLYTVTTLIHSVAFKALVGSIFFQIVVLYVISKTPNPAYWKLIFGLALLISVSKLPDFKRWSPGTASSEAISEGVVLEGIGVSYDLGYESRVVFENLSVRFPCGVNYVWGANGAGKSTLLNCIRGMVKAQQGHVYVNGIDVANLPAHKRRTFLLTQNPYRSLAPELSAFENVAAAGYHRRHAVIFPTPNRVWEDLRRDVNNIGLEDLKVDDRKIWLQTAESLSGGQAQRLNLFMALASNADVILADEPSSGLDHDNLDRLISVFQSFAAAGKTLIIATHDSRLYEKEGNHFKMSEGTIVPVAGQTPLVFSNVS